MTPWYFWAHDSLRWPVIFALIEVDVYFTKER